MKTLRRLLLVLLGVAPLLYLPLRAAESPDAPPAEAPATEAPPANMPPSDAPAAPEADAPAAPDDANAAAEEPEDFGERVSADNNLSFPVDI